MAIADKVDVAPAKPDGGNLIAILAEHWPAVFISEAWRPHKPLQVGIRHNLITAGLMKPWEIGRALRCYTKRYQYRLAVAAGGQRIDLDGNPVGDVTPEEALHAHRCWRHCTPRRPQQLLRAQP
jgi:ProP effector